MYNQEAKHKEAWEIGARVLEAIGVSFTKGKKYSEEPKIMTIEEKQDEERENFYKFFEKYRG